MSDASDFNARIIDEFRANGGQISGDMARLPLLLVHHKGAKTGTQRVNPVAYHNLVANPDTVVEVGRETIPVRARVARGEERARIWARQKEAVPVFAEYEQRTAREIPVVVLERR
jgi:hypothetical protein